MKNLKIKFYLDTPAILNRYLTIDSILLFQYFKNKPKKDKTFSFDEIDFLDKKNGVLSGSVWYVPEENYLDVEHNVIIKKVDTREYETIFRKKIDTSRGAYKAYMLGFESLITEYIYFYVKGDKEKIERLLNEVKFIGKKGKIGYGKIKRIEIEETDEDKGIVLDDTTASKPLPCSQGYLKSRRVGFYRPIPPYYLKDKIEPCYLPPRALIETKDETFKNDFKALCDMQYVSPTEFARKHAVSIDMEYEVKLPKRVKIIDRNLNEKHRCVICGQLKNEGYLGNVKDIVPKTFNDYPFLERGNFICTDCMWSLKKEKELGNIFIAPNQTPFYLKGGKMSEKDPKEFRKNFFLNLDKMTPPFLIALKSTKNSQHTVFKSKVAISNAIVPFSIGTEEELWLDVPLLKEAFEEANRIINENDCIRKGHLTSPEVIQTKRFGLSYKCNTQKNREILSNFYKKYDRSIRIILNYIL